jgi:3-oxoadipate enol-lactonase
VTEALGVDDGVSASTSMDSRTVAVGDIDLVIAEAGAGGRPLFLLHGFTGAKEDFTEWLDPLAARGWHAVAPDHRGHGASSQPASDDAYSFSLMATDCLGLADALGWDRFVLLGHSMGGMVAQVMAVTAPERLAGLVLMDTAHGPVEGVDPELVATVVAIVRDRGTDGLADLMDNYTSPLETAAHRRLMEHRSGYAEFGERKLRATSPHLYAAMSAQFLECPDRLAQLGTLPASVPALVMVGDQDAPFIGASKRMAKTIAGASLAVIADAGHSPQFENPDGWWTALTEFLDHID